LEVQVNKYKMTESQKLLSDFKFYSSYSKYLKDDERMETWEESVDRVMKMHYEKYADKITPELQSYLDFATEIYKKKRVLGSQRALQFGGVSILKHEMKMFNCLVSYADRIEFFKETMYLLLCGCGVGFSVQHKHIETLPKVGKRLQGVKTFVIEDSIEGWSDAIGVLMSSYSLQDSKFQEYYGYRIDFDYSRIRPKGSYISGGFKAPGHEGLKNSLTKIQELLDKEINGKEEIPLRSIIVYDIIMHMADAVLSGGVRRSATICLFSNDDNEMLNAKTGDWYIKNPQRGRSNNSVILIRNKTSREQFSSIMQSVKSWGEPGFVWSEDEDIIFNPCVSKDSVINTDEGLYNVENLIDKSYNPLIDGKVYKSLRGFWKTGTKDLFELTFKSGRTLKCTDNHKIMTNRGWVEAKNLEKTDKIRISNNSGFNLNLDHDSKEAKIGYLLGCFLGDGNISRNSIELKWWQNNKEIYRKQAFDILKELNMLYKPSSKEVSDSKSIYESIQSSKLFKEAVKRKIIVNNSKNLNTSVINGSHEYLLGIVAGYFDADGTVLVNKEKGNSLRITSIDIENLKSIQIILNSVGIYSKIYKNRRKGEFKSLPNGKGDKNLYLCKPIHELSISNENIKLFKDLVKIKNIDKIKSIDEILKSYVRNFNKTNFFETLESITYLGKEDVFDCTVEDLHAFECNGVYVHNCVEIGMTPYLESPNGNHHSGWQGCNLTEINGSLCNTEEEFYDACKASAIIGTLQAGYTNFKYVTNITKDIFERESLLGCSITGFMNNPKILFNPEIQKNGAKVIKETNKIISGLLGINQAARTTCVKPSGNASVLLGTGSGIHGEHSKKYFRNVQVNKEEDLGKYIKSINPKMVENSLWSNNNSDWVISFPIDAKEGSIFKKDLHGVKQLEFVKLTQQNWVEEGTNIDLCVNKHTRHNVSNTIVVDDWDEVENFIYENKQWFAGISLLGMSGDKDYAQAPFTEVIETEDIVRKYGKAALFASGLIVDGLHAFGHLWTACNALLFNSVIEESEFNSLLKKDWLRRAKQYADRYFNSDINKMTNCLKDVSLYHRWIEINRDFKSIDFQTIEIKPSYTEVDKLGAIACSGDQCTIQL